MKTRIGWKLWIAALLMALVCGAARAEAPVVPEDGLYTAWVSSSSDMFRIVKCVLDVKDGEVTATLTMSGQGYGYLFVGTGAEADAAPQQSWVPFVLDADGKKTFAIRIPGLDRDLDVAAYSIKYSKWYDRVLNFQSDSLRPYDAPPEPEQPGEAVVPPDGVYAIGASSDSALMKIESCTLKVKGGKIMAVLTLASDAYGYLFLGTAKDARDASDGAKAAAAVNANGTASYVLEIPSLDRDIELATFSTKKGLWYDRTLRLDSGAMEEQK